MKRHPGTKTLQTPRLLLRRFAEADAQAMFEGWAGRPEVVRFMRYNAHESVAETRAILRGWAFAYEEEEDFYTWAVTLRETGALAGSIGLTLHEGVPEPGYTLAPAFWGQGIAREALAAVLAYLADEGGAERFAACHAVANPASGAVLRSAGFQPEGEGSYESFDHTRVWPCIYYRLEAKDLVRGAPYRIMG